MNKSNDTRRGGSYVPDCAFDTARLISHALKFFDIIFLLLVSILQAAYCLFHLREAF